MIIFDEKKYAERIMKTGWYQTLQYQGIERRALARYLKYDLGYDDFKIRETISKIKSHRKEIYDDKTWDLIMNKIINAYDKSDYIKDFRIGISQSELDIILDQPTIELRNLLFALTVYFKWARNTKERLCMRGTDTWVKEADLDCCKIAGLDKLRKSERMTMFNVLYRNGNYKSDYIRRYHNIFTLPFIDDKTPVIIVDDFNDIIAYLEYYVNPDSCTHCETCGSLIYKTIHNKRHCKWCRKCRNYKTSQQT